MRLISPSRERSVLLFAMSAALIGADWVPMPLRTVAQGSQVIARLRITDAQSVTFDFLAEREVCGFNYTAETIEVVKGSGGELRFFSEFDATPFAANQEYLVFAKQRTAGATETTRELIASVPDERLRGRLLCALEANPLYASGAEPRLVIPFDPDATERWGGLWVRRQVEGPLWTDEIPHRDLVVGTDLVRPVVEWEDLRGRLQSYIHPQDSGQAPGRNDE